MLVLYHKVYDISCCYSLPNTREDAEGNVWHKIGVIGAQIHADNCPALVVHVRYGQSRANPSQPPVVGLMLVNLTKGENAQELFNRKYGSDSSAKLVPTPLLNKVNNQVVPPDTININSKNYGDNMRLYYVTSTNPAQQSIKRIRFRMVFGNGSGATNYYPSTLSDPNDSFFVVKDPGGTDRDTAQGYWQSIAWKNWNTTVYGWRYLEYSYDSNAVS